MKIIIILTSLLYTVGAHASPTLKIPENATSCAVTIGNTGDKVGVFYSCDGAEAAFYDNHNIDGPSLPLSETTKIISQMTVAGLTLVGITNSRETMHDLIFIRK
ncbi:MAG: hypothetical protein KDD22_01545 [Bdellovibrionales bacterium]|nr:hypothetical protein [Bdellovibrionales bacterium]